MYNTLIDFSLSTGPGCYTHQTTGPNKGNVPEALEGRVMGFSRLFDGRADVAVGTSLVARYKRDLALQKYVRDNFLGNTPKDDVVVGGPIYPSADGNYEFGEDDPTEEVLMTSVAIDVDSLEGRL